MSEKSLEHEMFVFYSADINEVYQDDCDVEEIRVRLGKKILAGQRALNQLLSPHRMGLSQRERGRLLRQGLMEKELVRKAMGNGEFQDRGKLEEAMAAVDDFVEQYLPLVVNMAKRYARKGIGFMDLVQDGNIGLMKAAARYDYRRTKFITHASWWIRQAMVRSIQNNSNTIRLSADTQEKRRLIQKVEYELEQEGEKITEYKIAKRSGLSARTIRRVLGMPKAIPLVKPEDYNEKCDPDGSLIDLAIKDLRATETAVEFEMLEELVAEIFDYLPWIDGNLAELLRVRHWETDENGKALPMRVIGHNRDGVSRQAVHQLLADAYKILREDEFYGPILYEWLYGEHKP